MFEKEIIIDAKGHLLGRLGAVVAKELLAGQRIVVVRAEKFVLSGSLFRRKTAFLEFLNKKHLTNPRRSGPYHFKAPSRMFWRAVRGMLPHKTQRGKAALERLKIFEGIPHPYSLKKRRVVPIALKAVRLQAGRKSCLLGDLSKEIGWNHGQTVAKLEKKREERASLYFQKKSKLNKAIDAETDKLADVKNLRSQLAALGY
jgi:large subunit ribosomal protein L13Ae